MRALRYRPDTRSVALDPHAPDPKPAPGDALIRVTLASLDQNDLLVAPDATKPFTLGHQFVGVVESVSDKTFASLVANRVVSQPHIPCAACDLCRGGAPAHCRSRRILGSPSLDGTLAQRASIPARALVRVPDSIDDEAALLAVPLASALHAARQVRLDRKAFVTVIGDNLIALLCAQVMAKLNATVRLLGQHADRMEVCEKWGVRHRPLHEAGRRADQDVVIECTGAHTGLQAAVGLLKPRGMLIAKTRPAAPFPFDLATFIDNELELVGSSIDSVTEAIAALANGDIETAALAPTRLNLEGAPAAITSAPLRTAIAA